MRSMKRRSRGKGGHRSDLARERMDVGLALTDFGEEAFRRRLARKRPTLSDAEIAAAGAAWYRLRPGSEFGDSVGRPVALRGGS
jgi:hypothetical protein